MRTGPLALLFASTLASLGGCSGAGFCTDGEKRCGGRCVAAQSDPENCGGCDVSCPVEQVCSLGSCQASCESGLERCDRSCVDLASDARNCGACGVDCGEGGVCQEGACGGRTDGGIGPDAGPAACQERVPLQSSGVYDIPLKVVALSGRVTRNGAALADGSRGRLVFANVRGGERRMPPLATSGEATYQGELFAGSYDVFFEPPSSCTEAAPVPCQRVKLKSKLALQQSGTLDLDLQVISISGRLTRNGATLPDGVSSRGSIVFVLEGRERRMPSLGATGEATYQGDLVAGTYDVFFQPPSSCSESGPLPCQRARLRSKLALQQSGTLDLDLKVISVSGRVTRNGGELPESTSSSRGSISFALVDGGERRMPALSAYGEATFQGELVAGSYDVYYQPPSSCVDKGPLPCQRARLRTKIALQQSGTLDLDLKVVALSGRVTRNGMAVPDGDYGRGSIAFSDEAGERRMPALSATGEATYQGELLAGTYDVFYQPPSSCSEPAPLPCQRGKLRAKLSVQQSGALDLDLKVVAISGRVARNGGILAEGSRGSIAFATEAGERRMPSLPTSGEATFQGELLAGTYEVYYQPSSYCSETSPLPCQRVKLRTKLGLQQNGTLDLDLKVIAVSGRVTRNGATLPDGSSGRGAVLFGLWEGSERRMPSLAAAGEATFQGELFAGNYDVRYQPPSTCSDSAPLPCQSFLVAGCPASPTSPP